MEVNNIYSNDIALVKVTGEVNMTTNPDFEKSVLMALNQEGISKIILDLKEVPLISSAGLRTLIMAERTGRKKTRAVEINISDSGFVKEILFISGMYSILNIKEIKSE